MSQHVPETCNESNGLWLPLIEYSVKSGVSLSTIRRKIKNNSLQYRLEKGRYLILFNDKNNNAARQPMPATDSGRYMELEPVRPLPAHQGPRVSTISSSPTTASSEHDAWNMPWVEKSVRMVSDAYEHALKEKEERIRLLERQNKALEERLNELRLLVRCLEEKYEVRY